MKDKNIKIGIEEIKKIIMTDVEKGHIYNNILKYEDKPKQTKSPWYLYSFTILSQKTKLAYLILIPVIFILSGGGVVFASTDSMPDSVLYPIKVNIVEPIEGAFNFSTKAKAQHESKLAEKRLVEAEIMASNGKLDEVSETKINKLLAKHTNALNNVLGKVKTTDVELEDVEIIATDFRAQMNAHARVLDIIADKNNKKSEKNIEIIEGTEVKTKNIKISNTARLGADKIKNISDKRDGDKINRIKEKKDKVKNIVDNTDKDINLILSEENNPKDFVTKDAYKKMDQAKAYLYDANKKNEEGKLEEAYSSLLDSESSAKEASILFKEGQKMKNRLNIED